MCIEFITLVVVKLFVPLGESNGSSLINVVPSPFPRSLYSFHPYILLQTSPHRNNRSLLQYSPRFQAKTRHTTFIIAARTHTIPEQLVRVYFCDFFLLEVF